MNNPHTTWAGIVALLILACLVAFLASSGNLNGETIMVISLLGGVGGANAIGNLLSHDSKKSE